SKRLTHRPAGSSLLLFSFFLFPSLCGAEIFIEPRIGFHGVFQLGRPFPLEIELSNSGRPAEGILEITVWKGGATKGGAPYPLYYRRDVFLSPQSRKTVQVTVDPDFISRSLKILFLRPRRDVSAGDRSAASLFSVPGDSAGERRQYDSSGFSRFHFDESFGCPHIGRVAARSESVARRLAFDSLRPILARSFSGATPCPRHLADSGRKNGNSRQPQLLPLPRAAH